MKNQKNKIINIIKISTFSVLILAVAAWMIISPDKEFSNSERRGLKKMPAVTATRISTGQFMKDFDDFAMDQFPLRDNFRSIKAYTTRFCFGMQDNHKLYIKNGYITQLEYPLNQEKLNKNLKLLNSIYTQYLKDTDCKIYLSIIPDKNYYLKSPLQLNYKEFTDTVKNQLSFAQYIDISHTLELESFYKTDQHWKQECLIKTAQEISQALNVKLSENFDVQTLENPFYGAYYGQAALKMSPDTIKYLTNEKILSCQVTSYNTGRGQTSNMYDMKKATGRDPYEMFLSGSDALLTIENPSAETPKELIIFRDSFGSSLTPLLISPYSKITLIDLRYLQPAVIKNYINFQTQDILFLYSTLVLNK